MKGTQTAQWHEQQPEAGSPGVHVCMQACACRRVHAGVLAPAWGELPGREGQGRRLQCPGVQVESYLPHTNPTKPSSGSSLYKQGHTGLGPSHLTGTLTRELTLRAAGHKH